MPVTEQKKKKTQERKVVRLSDCLSVTRAPKESCPHGCTAFYLNTTHCNYTLATRESQDWLDALCLLAFQKDPGESDKGGFERGNVCTMEDNELYSSWKTDLILPPNQYQVTVHTTEASRRCQLAGDYLLSPEKQALKLLAINTGHVIYCWPYILLRKFGQVEGGFSIEAGRRCDSGEGLFIFLSRRGSEIFQTILKHCCAERKSSLKPLSDNRKSYMGQWPVQLPTTTEKPTAAAAAAAADADAVDDSANHYATINDTAVNVKKLPVVKPYLSTSMEDVREGGEDEDTRCRSLEAVNMGNLMDDDIYCNLRRTTPPIIRKDVVKPEINTDCIYSDLKAVHSRSNPRLQPFPPALPQPVPPPPPCTPPLSDFFALPKPRYQWQPPVNNNIQPGCNAQAQAVDDMKEMEEAISSSRATPTEAPGSFKHRLAEIISKDLAKFQPPLPPGPGSPTLYD
ncbi:Docking protein 2 [Collichthys lucidus]|uniref:Docking protein 2 n=1 Tax=Collichthys lucidus TaxID=240159 RepID=A0A4U5UEN9_COLLU|nr:Docking protein 2 [Collichthys lucidus]